MKAMVNMALRLALITAVSALLLAVLNTFTEPVIAERKAAELQAALAALAGDGIPGEEEESPADGVASRWPVSGGSGGWIMELEASGYGGPMTVVAAFASDGTVTNARLLDNNETVGFGKKAEAPGYMDIFVGTGGDGPVPTTKGALGSDVDVVSGATVTFTAISRSIAEGSRLAAEWSE